MIMIRLFVLITVSFVAVVIHRLFFLQPRRMKKTQRATIRRELLQDMSIRDFNRVLKLAYENNKGDPQGFVREVPYVCDDYDSFDMEGMCGFINGTYDIKKSMFASYLVKVLRDES